MKVPLHYRFFLRYILRTGGVVHLKFSEDILKRLTTSRYELLEKLREKPEIFNFAGFSPELFYSMGKVRIVYDEKNNRAFLIDHYVFYPTCGNDQEHFQGCDCERKSWNDYEIKFYIGGIIQRILEKLNLHIYISVSNIGTLVSWCILRFAFRKGLPGHKIKNVKKLFSILITDYKIEINCSDWFVHKLGKPFWTICEFKYEELWD